MCESFDNETLANERVGMGEYLDQLSANEMAYVIYPCDTKLVVVGMDRMKVTGAQNEGA